MTMTSPRHAVKTSLPVELGLLPLLFGGSIGFFVENAHFGERSARSR